MELLPQEGRQPTEASVGQGSAPGSRPRERTPLGSFLPGSWHLELREKRFMVL